MNTVSVKLGDTVLIWEQRRGIREATVMKVARIWITVGEGFHEERFRLDTQTDGSEYGYSKRFYTPAQWVERQQRDEAATFLREQGIDLRHGSPWFGREVELAALIRSADAVVLR